jgi:hypothetical protein
MWPDLLKNYTTFGAAPKQATVGFSGSAQGLLLGGAAGLPLRSRRPVLMASAAEVPAAYAFRNVSNVISGGTPIRTGKPNVPSPRFT